MVVEEVVVVVVVPRELISVCVIPAFYTIVIHTVELVLGEVTLGRPSVFWRPQSWARIVSNNNVPAMTGHLSNATNKPHVPNRYIYLLLLIKTLDEISLEKYVLICLIST